jgi:hypothetical protein
LRCSEVSQDAEKLDEERVLYRTAKLTWQRSLRSLVYSEMPVNRAQCCKGRGPVMGFALGRRSNATNCGPVNRADYPP